MGTGADVQQPRHPCSSTEGPPVTEERPEPGSPGGSELAVGPARALHRGTAPSS